MGSLDYYCPICLEGFTPENEGYFYCIRCQCLGHESCLQQDIDSFDRGAGSAMCCMCRKIGLVIPQKHVLFNSVILTMENPEALKEEIDSLKLEIAELGKTRKTKFEKLEKELAEKLANFNRTLNLIVEEETIKRLNQERFNTTKNLHELVRRLYNEIQRLELRRGMIIRELETLTVKFHEMLNEKQVQEAKLQEAMNRTENEKRIFETIKTNRCKKLEQKRLIGMIKLQAEKAKENIKDLEKYIDGTYSVHDLQYTVSQDKFNKLLKSVMLFVDYVVDL